MFRLFSILIGFALGHIQTSYILGKAIKKIDIRDYGSGSAGMTNTARVMGGKTAIIVLLVDVLKAFGAYLICSAIFQGSGSFFAFGGGIAGAVPGCWGAFGAILGHMFPVYMKFRGGKSVACGIGFVLAMDFRVAGIILLIAAVILIATKFVSLAAIITAVLTPIATALFGLGTEAALIWAGAAALIIFKHKANIGRLLKGNENKLGHKIDIKEKG